MNAYPPLSDSIGMQLADAIDTAITHELDCPAGCDTQGGTFSFGVGYMGIEFCKGNQSYPSNHYRIDIQLIYNCLPQPLSRSVFIPTHTVDTYGVHTIANHYQQKTFMYLFR